MASKAYVLKMKVDNISAGFGGDKDHCVRLEEEMPDAKTNSKRGAFMPVSTPRDTCTFHCADSSEFHIGDEVEVHVTPKGQKLVADTDGDGK